MWSEVKKIVYKHPDMSTYSIPLMAQKKRTTIYCGSVVEVNLVLVYSQKIN